MIVLDWINPADLTDAELRSLIELPTGLEGLKYWIVKSDKVVWLRLADDDSEEAEETRHRILVRACQRQEAHHGHLRERRARGNPRRRDLIEVRMKGQVWRFVGTERRPQGFRDDITGRRAYIAHTLLGTQTGETLEVTSSTLVDAYRRLGVILGWP